MNRRAQCYLEAIEGKRFGRRLAAIPFRLPKKDMPGLCTNPEALHTKHLRMGYGPVGSLQKV